MKTNKEILFSIIDKAVEVEEFLLVLGTLRALVKRLSFEESYLLGESLSSLYSHIKYSSNMKVDQAQRLLYAAIEAVFIVIEESKNSRHF